MSDYPDDLDNLEKARGDSYYSDSDPEVKAELDAIQKGDHDYGDMFYDYFESEEFKTIIHNLVDTMNHDVFASNLKNDFINIGVSILHIFLNHLKANEESHLERAHVAANAKRLNNVVK